MYQNNPYVNSYNQYNQYNQNPYPQSVQELKVMKDIEIKFIRLLLHY